MKLIRLAYALPLLAAAAPLAAQDTLTTPPSRITTKEIDAHLRFLSSDLLEGRAPGTRGGRLATEYIASQLQAYGLKPGAADSSYFQRVPIDIVKSDPQSISVKATGKATASLVSPNDVIVWAGSAAPSSTAKGELVFIGYGATAPEYKWDDFKGVDVRGKILLVLVNDPPAPVSEPNLFGGNAMTYYGRWTYKYEEAERRGAAGMLIVHRTIPAGYPWQVVLSSNIGTHRLLPRDPMLPPPLGVRGWIQDSSAIALLAQAGLDLGKLRNDAESRSFRPVSTGIMMDISFNNSVQHLQTENVVGVVPGLDPKLRSEYVVYSAHWDHFGIGLPVNGDSIYNGAADNASGVSTVLAIAHSAAEGVKPRRSQMFLFVTAEESGLLGSEYFGQHPSVPATSIIADLNIDNPRLTGRFKTLEVLGENKSSLGPLLAAMVKPAGITIMPEAHPEQGHFYRSDHFSLAKVGIPAIDVKGGVDIEGRDANWGRLQAEDYTAHRYHQPSDDYAHIASLDDAAQLGEIVYRFGFQLANAETIPTWNRDAEFRAAREAALRNR
jgi:Zn-dependent M28 family amino/carboxypeptidase